MKKKQLSPLPPAYLPAKCSADLLCATLFLTLLSRGWLTIRWGHPLRGVLWDESSMSWIVAHSGISWAEHQTQSDQWITPLIQCLGIAWILSSLAMLFIWWKHRIKTPQVSDEATLTTTREPTQKIQIPKSWLAFLLILSSLSLLDIYSRFFEADYAVGALLEFACQALSPLVLMVYWSRPDKTCSWMRLVMIGLSMTFIGHGLFAIGFHPVPRHFLTMSMDLLSCSEDTSRWTLRAVACCDFLAAFGLWFSTTRKSALGYMLFWGFATALARILTLTDSAQNHWNLDAAIPETLVRTSHWTFALVLLLALKPKDRKPFTERP